MSSCLGLLAVLWCVNAFIALIAKGLVGCVMALIVGPLVWMVR